MKTIEEIVELAIEHPEQLPSVMMYCQWMAGKLDFQPFTEWVAQETGGYASLPEVPRYRIVRGSLRGSFVKFPYEWSDETVPPSVIEPELKNMAESIRLFQPVSVLNSIRDDGTAFFPVVAEQTVLQLINMHYSPTTRFLDLRIQLYPNALQAVLGDIRQRVVAFLSEISTKYPTFDSLEKIKPGDLEKLEEALDQPFQIGHVENLIVGADRIFIDQSKNAIQHIHVGNWDDLDSYLDKVKVSDAQKARLRDLLDPVIAGGENPDAAEEVKRWVDEVAAQAVEGLGEVLHDGAKKAATDTLTDAIKKFAPAVGRWAWVATWELGKRHLGI